MTAITDKMQELARTKEEERQQQARDSDTLSTIVMPPVNTDPDQVSRPSAPPRRHRGGDGDLSTRGVLRRAETATAAGSTSDEAAERPRVDRPASDGDDSDDSEREVFGGRPGQLKRWPLPGEGDFNRSPKKVTAGRENDSDDSDYDEGSGDSDNESSNNNTRLPAAEPTTVPPVSWQTDTPQSTPTATPDESQADNSSLQQKQSQNDSADKENDEIHPGRTHVVRATVI